MTASTDASIDRYLVYRGTWFDPGVLIATATTNSYNESTSGNYRYQITAVDKAGPGYEFLASAVIVVAVNDLFEQSDDSIAAL